MGPREICSRASREPVATEYLALINNQDEILAYWCIASWFPDVLDFIPRLTITGPGFAADVLLRVLRWRIPQAGAAGRHEYSVS